MRAQIQASKPVKNKIRSVCHPCHFIQVCTGNVYFTQAASSLLQASEFSEGPQIHNLCLAGCQKYPCWV